MMTRPFKHYILIRFNLGLYSNNPHKISHPKIWMDHRLRLFEDYCLPSLAAQTNKNFVLILAFDENTPDEIISMYDYMDRVQVIYERPDLWLRQQPPEADWIITSRFDNDDMYKPTFVDSIQKAFRYEEEIIDIDYIAWHMYTNKYFTSARRAANSPFLSLCERWDGPICTALGRPHSTMPEHYPARKLDVQAVQIIHDRNISNQIRGEEI